MGCITNTWRNAANTDHKGLLRTVVTNASVVDDAVTGDSVGGGVVVGSLDTPRGCGLFRS